MDNIVKHAIIPAGGLGSRMKIIDPSLPKELLPVNGKPVIQYALEEIVTAGISHVTLIINSEKEIVRTYLKDKNFAKKFYSKAVEDLEYVISQLNIQFLYQSNPSGEMDAISLGEITVNNNPFVVIYPDDLHFPVGRVLKGLCYIYRKYRKNTIALTKVNSGNFEIVGNTGRVNIKEKENNLYLIKEFLPKTEGHYILRFPNELRTCGYMISRPEIFDYIRQIKPQIVGEFNDIHVRRVMLKEYDFLGYLPNTNHFDVGNPKGYMAALIDRKK